MAYSPQTWSDGNASYPVSAARMSNIETGLQAAALVADQGVQILTTTQKTALTPSTGWMVFDTTLGLYQYWNGSAWQTWGGDTGWIAFSGYNSGWSTYSGPASGGSAAGYRRVGNVVRLGGKVNAGSGTMLTLPAGFRPSVQVDFAIPTIVTANSMWDLRINTSGAINMYTTGTGTVPSLDGVTFTTD